MKYTLHHPFGLVLPLLVGVALAVAGCSKDDNPTTPSKAGTFSGTPVTIGNATGNTWVTLDAAGNQTSFGLRIKEAALTGLTTDTMGTEFTLDIPSQAIDQPYQHVSIQWRPYGHPPPGVYDAPHFDVRWFLTTMAERLASNDSATAEMPVNPNLVAPNYVSSHVLIPTMGISWVDTTSDEFQHKGFTSTFQYQYYGGKQVSIQIAVSKAFMEGKTTRTEPIKQPQAFSKSGFWPTSYTISFDNSTKEFMITLSGLVKH